MKLVKKYSMDIIFYLGGDVTHLQLITLKMICYCIENDIKFNEDISNKNNTRFLKQYYDLTIVSCWISFGKQFNYVVS